MYKLEYVVPIFITFVVLERFLERRESKALRHGWFQDLLYMFLNPILISEGIIGVMFIVGVGPYLRELTPEVVKAWVGALSLWWAIPLAVLIGDLGFYLHHRLFHSVPFLWRFHSVHHSSEHLDALAAVRVHPVDQIASQLFSILPLYALGFPGPVMIVFTLFYLVQSFYVHSNLKGSWGPLRFLLATPEFHHWHHANQKEAYDKNFAGQLPLWDILFGTLHRPASQWPEKYGVNPKLPHSFFQQMVYPFLPRKKKRRNLPASATPGEAPVPELGPATPLATGENTRPSAQPVEASPALAKTGVGGL